MKTYLRYFFVFFIISIGAWLIVKPLKNNQDLPPGGNFTLQSSKGMVSLNQFQNKIVLLYFGYTFCPDVCPMGLGYLTQSFEKLSESEKEQVQVLFVTLDPERDQLDKMDQYLNFFNKKFIALKGNEKELSEITKKYDVKYKIHQDENRSYTIDHSSYIYLINKNGKLSEVLPHTLTPETMISFIKKNL